MQLPIVFIGIGAIFWLFYLAIYHLNWQRAVKLSLIIVIFEGVLRKWVLPQASELIYFLKDLVILLAYLKYYLSSESKYKFKFNIFNIFLVLTISWCLLHVFNPSLGSPIIGFFGLKAYLFYIPLMWMLPSLFKTEEEFYRFLRNFMLTTIPVCLLAVAQYFSPPESPINIWAGGQEANATAGGAIRVTGTFPYIVGYSSYLTVCFSILIPMLTQRQPPFWRWLTFIEALLIAGTSFMTGARGLLAFEILFIVAYFSILVLTQPSLFSRSTKKLFVPITLVSILVPTFFSKAIGTFLTRVNTSEDSQDFSGRAFSAFDEPWQAMQFKGFFDGYGTGATHQASFVLRKILNLPNGEAPPPSEGELGRVVLEIGLFGFLLWYGTRIVLMFANWQVFVKLRSPFLRQLALSVLLLQAINITNQFVFNNTLSIYSWFFSGVTLLFPKLDYQQFSSYGYSESQRYV